MKARDRHRAKLLEYLGNPANDFLARSKYPEILGVTRVWLYKLFTPDDLSGLEKDALDLRRKQYARYIGQADRGLLKRAAEGDPQACKLVYQRLEGWTEKKRIDTDCTIRTIVLDDLDNNKV